MANPAIIQPASVEAWSYLASYADLRAVYGSDSAAAAQHYNVTGHPVENRAITFDVYQYMAANTDLIRAFSTNTVSAARHYVVTGISEDRVTTFNAAAYLAANTDLQTAFAADGNSANDVEQALHHYVTQGYWEIADGRRASTSSDFTLTLGNDEKTANTFNSTPQLIPGTGYMTTLSDNDKLTGIGTNPTLNVEIGTRTDFNSNDLIIQPKLYNIQTINVEWTSDEVKELELADADALNTLNVNRITVNNAKVSHTDLSATLSAITLNDATRGGDVSFISREEVLTGTADVLAFGVNNARVHSVTLNEGGDNDADLGFYYETINMASNATNDIDTLTIGANTREDLENGLPSGTTTQTLSITAGASVGAAGSLEINQLTANGLETINIIANHRVDIADDKLLPLSPANDGIATNDLETVNISGAANVMIDGLDTTKQDNVIDGLDTGKVLTVNAGTMTGNLKLGVATASDANSSEDYAFRADEDLKVTSGSGNDQIHTYGILAGDITTGAGNDVVAIRGGEMGYSNVEGVSQIDTGTGNDTVTAASLLVTARDKDESNNTGFDDVTAASIVTGDGNDSVTVASLTSRGDWDNITLTDGNKNDQQKIIGATVSTGTGTDTVVFTSVAEGASVDTGADNDTVTVGLTNDAVILAGDTDADVETLVDATHAAAANAYTNEVSALNEVDLLGAIVDLGAGANDVINFTESDAGIADSMYSAPTETTQSAFTIVGRDAEVRGAETMNVTVLDLVWVDSVTTTFDQDITKGGVQNDINVNIKGTQILNLTVANQIEDTDTADTIVQHTNGFHPVNDNNATDGQIIVDVMRFDTALTNINLVSQETVMQTGPASELYEAGTLTQFSVANMRTDVALSLKANEATGVTGALADDNILAIDKTTGVITINAAATDVALGISYAGVRGTADGATLTVDNESGANTQPQSGTDLSIGMWGTTTDVLDTDGDGDSTTVANAVSATDDDNMLVENFVLAFADTKSHSVDMNSFGDDNFTFSTLTNGSRESVNSLKVRSGGTAIAVNNVGTDAITFLGLAGTDVTASNVTVRVDQANNYTIATGSGEDVIDMRQDEVRADVVVATTGANNDTADRINAGENRDTMIVNGLNSLGTNNHVGATVSTIVNDDVFAGIDSVETVLVDTFAVTGNHGTISMTLDEQAGTGAGNTNVDTVRLVGNQSEVMNILVGNNFTVGTALNTTNTFGGAFTNGALLIDASTHTGATTLNIESKDDDTDVQIVNMDVRVNALTGADVAFTNTGSAASRTELAITTTSTVSTAFTLGATAAGAGTDGSVELDVYAGSVARIVMVEGQTAGAEAATNLNTVVINNAWTSAAFEFDASRMVDSDTNTATGGLTLTVDAGDTANLTVKGTANNDTIMTGRGSDIVDGNAGNDTIVGDEVVNNLELEVVNFAATYDAGDVITVTHNGQSVTATITADATTALSVATAIHNFATGGGVTISGTDFTSATTSVSGDKLRLTGVVAGTDYTVTATTNNAGDNTPQVQTLTISRTGNPGAADNDTETVEVQWRGTSYQIATVTEVSGPNDVVITYLPGKAAFDAAVSAAGGTPVSVISGTTPTANLTLTVTGLATGAPFDLMSVNILAGTFAGQQTTFTLSTVGGDMALDQINPIVVTETLARTIVGAADTINGGTGDDNISGLIGADVLDGGAGSDTLNYSLSLAAVTVNLATNVVSGGDAQGDTISNFENVTGSSYHDILTGSDGANILDGGAGHDTIFGGAGNDVITAGEGLDVVDGGAGIDTIGLTESGVAPSVQVKDTLVSDVIAVAHADLIRGFVSGTDKIDYNGTLHNGSEWNTDGIGVLPTDVITATTFALGLADPNANAGLVFIAQTGVVTTEFTTLLASNAANLTTNYLAFETQLVTSGALSGNIANLDTILHIDDSVLLVLDNDAAGSVVLRITNIDTATANTLTVDEVQLVGVFVDTTALAAADFI
jgi:Ca2+-binding RTX toxin-like protein